MAAPLGCAEALADCSPGLTPTEEAAFRELRRRHPKLAPSVTDSVDEMRRKQKAFISSCHPDRGGDPNDFVESMALWTVVIERNARRM